MLLLEGQFIKYYVQDRLLVNIEELKVQRNDRIGLVGRNGSGKTTLLKIMAQEIVAGEGKLIHHGSVELVPQFKRKDDTKSGGEITQAYMQRALSNRAAVLLLDEPTTNLDTAHIEWLERNLIDWQGALITVSHDRMFLDKICTKIWEIEEGILTAYNGNYSAYAAQKEFEMQQEEMAFEKYEKEKAQLELAIRKKEEKAQRATKAPKNISASELRIKGTKPYYASKQKKLRKTVSAFETRLEQLEQVKQSKSLPPIKMDILNEQEIKRQVIFRAKQVGGRVGNRILWHPADFYIRGGEKVAIIGSNGVGKTTLIKKIIQEDRGITVSSAIKIGYFAQNLSILEEQKTILENVTSTSKQSETVIRTVLARLHFFTDDVYKKVDVLSGGEKVKVALAKLFLSDVNMLVLDEPTNFLDIASLEALETLIQQYQGNVIFVSHDRLFVRNIATKIIEIKNQKLIVFDGTYAQYAQRLTNENRTATQDELLLIETKISAVLSRLSIEPSEELEAQFQALLKEKKRIKK